ncbi:hydroxymethylglutaryl-CoA synthase [Rhodobacteraceae bacterium KLH11]|nr:hydroxymethylglutaryl-CoA synthase [Rhodobacteraceae bacterium KLH11]
MTSGAKNVKVGIDSLSFFVPGAYLELEALAERHGVNPDKFEVGLGQKKIALTGFDEDVVTLAAEAALPILDAEGVEGIDTLLFATETGIDQSKAAGVYVHRLLNLSPNCRTVELKQACYSATAALQMACGYVSRNPEKKVLVVASDVSRYDLDSAAEATQGCGAVAMLVSVSPKLLTLDPVAGCFTEDIMDFWRPNYRKTPLVDGKYSTLRYLNALEQCWKDYQKNGGRAYGEFVQFCYHLPFSRMGEKGHRHLAKLANGEPNLDRCKASLVYNREVGNCYAASLYMGLASALENTEIDLTGKPIGLYSYGSGAVAEFFAAEVQPGYGDHLLKKRHKALLDDRKAVSYDTYLSLRAVPDPQDGSSVEMPRLARGRYRLAKIDKHKRHYVNASS